MDLTTTILYENKLAHLTPKTFTGVLGKGQEDKEGNIWFVTEGAGLLCYNPATQEQKTYLLNPAPDAYNKTYLKKETDPYYD